MWVLLSWSFKMNNPDIFIDAVNPFLSVVLITNIFILGFILVVSIYNQDRWAVMTQEVKMRLLVYIRYFIYLVIWETLIIGGVLFKGNNINNADVFIDFIDPFLSIILITNMLISLIMLIGLFYKEIKEILTDIPTMEIPGIVKTISLIGAVYFITLIVWEIAIASEIIFT